MGWIIPNSHGSAWVAYTWARWLPRPGSALLKRRQRPKAQRAPAVSCIRTLRGAGTNIGSMGEDGSPGKWRWQQPWDLTTMGWSYAVSNFEIKLYKMGILPMIWKIGKWIWRLKKITMTAAWFQGWVKDHDFFDDFNGGFTMRIDEKWGF